MTTDSNSAKGYATLRPSSTKGFATSVKATTIGTAPKHKGPGEVAITKSS